MAKNGDFTVKPILIDFPESFDTNRLTIRSPMPGDGIELQAAIAETIEELSPWMHWADHIPTVEEAEENVRRARCKFLAREDLRLGLFLKGTSTLVGGSGLHRIDWDVPKFEIGYWLRKRFQRQGYATEAADGITKFAFEVLGAKRVEIRCDPKNTRSRRIPERLGFTLEGTLRNNAVTPTGEVRDTLVFSKIRIDC